MSQQLELTELAELTQETGESLLIGSIEEENPPLSTFNSSYSLIREVQKDGVFFLVYSKTKTSLLFFFTKSFLVNKFEFLR